MATSTRTWLPPLAGILAAVAVVLAGVALRGTPDGGSPSATTTTEASRRPSKSGTSTTAPPTTATPSTVTAPTTAPGSATTAAPTTAPASGPARPQDGGRPSATTTPGGPGGAPFAPAGATLYSSLEWPNSKDWVYTGTGSMVDGCRRTKDAAAAAGYSTFGDCVDMGGPIAVQFSGQGVNGGITATDGSVQVTVAKP